MTVTWLRLRSSQEELKAALAEKKRVAAKAASQAAAAAAEQSRLKAEVQRLTGAAAAAAEAGEKPPLTGMAAVKGALGMNLQSELAKARLRAGAGVQLRGRLFLRAASPGTTEVYVAVFVR